MNRFLLVQFFAGCLAATLSGQSIELPKAPLQQRTSGALGQDELVSLAINWRGDLAAVGNAARGQQGGQDISFVTYDAQLNKLLERHIGRQGDDGAARIAVLPDGRYLVAGYSTRPGGRNKSRASYFGKRDGWLLVLDERGETEQELLLGTAGDDEFVDVAVCPDGSIWIAGNSQAQAWIVRLDAALRVQWEKKIDYHRLPTRAEAATRMPDGSFFILGGIRELERKHLWLAGVDPEGQAIMEKIYPYSQAENGAGIAVVDSNTLAIIGTVTDIRERENGFISLLDRSGVMRLYQPLGGREFDQLHTLIRTHHGQLLTGGGSASFERGSRRISAWLTALDKKGQVAQNQYYGSKLDDEVLALAEHPDGRLFAVGTTARQVLKMRQGWLFQLSARSERKAKAGTLHFETGAVTYPDTSGFLTKKRAFIPFSLYNKGEKGQCNLRVLVQGERPGADACLRLPGNRSVLLPPLAAGERLDWGIPLLVAENSPPGRYRFSIRLFQGETAFGEPQIVEISVGEPALPRLELSILAPDSAFVVGREDFLLAEVRNMGGSIAREVTLSGGGPEGIVFPASVSLGDIAPGARVTQGLPLRAQQPGSASVHLRAVDGSLSATAEAGAQLEIVSAPVNTEPVSKPARTIAVWIYPNPDNFEGSTLVWTQEDITVQVKVVSSGQAVVRQQFCIEINGEPCPTGTKFDEVQIKGDRTHKTFSQTIRLQRGENRIRALLQTADGAVSSDWLHIVYEPARPNLHIVSIGIPSADLKYTSKDAADFAQAIASERNIAFGKIFLDTLLMEERTTKTEIMKTLRRLQYRYNDLQILPKDLLVIFISGHGLGAYDGSFRVAASDYDAPFLQETSLDFEQEIVNYLKSLSCRKLFFVDACHSGTVAGAGLAGIAARNNGLNMLVSCQADEYSYEDDTWKNGAFTHALVRGFDTFSRQPAALDRNNDNKLDLTELFGYTQKDVPALVDKKRPKPKTDQHPNLILAESGNPPVLFELKKK